MSWGGGGFGGSHDAGSSWGDRSHRADNPTPLGTHHEKCIACNTSRWSNRGLMKPHYDETCPGCRRDRSMGQTTWDSFGGFEHLDYAVGALVLGASYAHAQKAERKEQEALLKFLKKGSGNTVTRIPKHGPQGLATKSLWGDNEPDEVESPNSKRRVSARPRTVPNVLRLNSEGQSSVSSEEEEEEDEIGAETGEQQGTIFSPTVRKFLSLWETREPPRMAGKSLWGARDNRCSRVAKKSLFD